MGKWKRKYEDERSYANAMTNKCFEMYGENMTLKMKNEMLKRAWDYTEKEPIKTFTDYNISQRAMTEHEIRQIDEQIEELKNRKQMLVDRVRVC